MAATQYFEQVQKIFIAFYQRPADPAGLKYWAQRVDAAGGDFGAVIDAFASSPEAVALYGTIDAATIGTVIDKLYLALFNTTPDATGKAFYTEGFANGTFTAGTIALAVLNGAQNDDLVAVQNKVQVANNFTQQVDGRPLTDAYFGSGTSFNVTYAGDTDAQAARDILKGVTFNAASVLSPSQVTELLKTQIADATDPIIGQSGGQTYTLTTGVDSLTGTVGNDTFVASGAVTNVVGTPFTAASTSLNTADKLVGGAGIDSLNFTVEGAENGVGVAYNVPAADVSGIEIINVRNVATAGTDTLTVNAGNFVGATEFYSDRSTTNMDFTNVAAGSTVGFKGNGTNAATGNVTATYLAGVTAANVSLQGGDSTTAGANTATLTVNGANLTSATITASGGGTNTINGVTFGGAVTALTVDAQSNIATGLITGLAPATKITVKGAGTANIGTLQATNVTEVDASANTGGVTATLNNVAGLKFTGGAGNDVLTTGAILAGAGLVDAGAGTADRLVVTNSTFITAAAGKLYKGFEQLQVTDAGANVTVDVTQLADNNTISSIRISDAGSTTGVTNLSAAQAAAVSIVAANATGAITIGVKDASVAGQIDTVKAALTTTTAAGTAQAIDLTSLVLTGVEKLELTGNGTVGATTGAVTLTTAAATSLDSIIVKNAGVNSITIAAGQASTNLVVDASGSTGATTINASAYATTTGAQLLGGSGHDVLFGSALADKLVGGDGSDVISGAGTATVTVGSATATTNAVLTAIAAPAGFAADVLTGGAGRDVFVFAPGAGNTVAVASSITDLNLGGTTLVTGVDQIYFDGTAGAATILTLTAAQQATVTAAATLAAAVDAAINAIDATANGVAQFTYGTDSYLVINGATASTTFTATADLLVKITGVAGTLDASDIVII